jgi:tetratricopeptide (TPR) repeat protein
MEAMSRQRRRLTFVLLGLMAAAAIVSLQAQSQTRQSERVRLGVRHFERAFYELTPNRRHVEASRELDLAIAAFEAEVQAGPPSATVHSYLGRIYSLKNDYKKAAAHYDRLSEIEPLNADACVLAALAYAEDGQPDEARARLEAAKLRTSDADGLARLAEYVRRLDGAKR